MSNVEMKIVVLHPSNDVSTSPFAHLDPAHDLSRYLPEHSWTHVSIQKATAVRQLVELARAGYDVFYNACDGAWDEDRPGLEVVQTLERLGVAFTGAGSDFYDPPRRAMKMAAHTAGVAVPAFVEVRSNHDVARALRDLRFPMIVKHPYGYASVGMTRDSRVTDDESLRREIARMIEAYGGALVEEFVEGREFTVLVTEPRAEENGPWVLTPIEFTFPAGETFKHFDLKWRSYEGLVPRLVDDTELNRELKHAASVVFEALSGSGFGRCDFRTDASGKVQFLEINPNCSIFYPKGQFGSADFILARDPAGHRGFLEHLLLCASKRRERRHRAWEIQFRRDAGFGLVATERIAAGAPAVRYEETSHVLVSRRHVERHWKGLKSKWFERYAWPMTAEMHVLWSENPEDWRPINHSCDPNTWLDGLDLVARRDIEKDEPLTADYATFCGPAMASFECACGSELCRRIVRGTDYLREEIRERFANHASDFVKSAWRHADEQMHAPHEIVPCTFGLGLVSRRAWATGDVISPLSWGERSPHPTRWTLQCDDDQHAEPLPAELKYINHSCDPNVQFDMGAAVVRAIKDISPGEELSFFYPATEWAMAESFTCGCGASTCIGRVSGASQISGEILERYVLSRVIARKLAKTGSGLLLHTSMRIRARPG